MFNNGLDSRSQVTNPCILRLGRILRCRHQILIYQMQRVVEAIPRRLLPTTRRGHARRLIR